MPRYEYECDKCGPFEVTQRFSDAALTTHEECGSPAHRLISRSAFALKGSGWYADGYGGGAGAKESDKADATAKVPKADKADKAEKSADSSAAPASTPSESKASDTKPAA